jgi:hypothetical protein
MFSMETVQRFKKELAEFLDKTLALTLSEEKTKITDLTSEPALFLGYHVQLDKKAKIKIGFAAVRINGKTPFHKRTTGRLIRSNT